jgi:myo-inositol 2-dehydrogenase/D-chiro-inositol 1-dehydrogenase
MGSIHLNTITNHVSVARVAAISGINPQRASSEANRWGALAHYTDALDLIHDHKVDAIVIASPADTHAELTIAAILARKPVFVEKPLSTSSSDALRVVNTENATACRRVRLGFMRRYDPAYLALKDVVASGLIGSPLMVHCAHRLMAVPPTFTSEMLITEGLTHEIDVARWLTSSEIAAVRVYTPGPSGRAAPGVADPQFVVLETDSGALIDVEISVNAGYSYDIRCEVVCEDGTSELADFSRIHIRHKQYASSPLVRSWADRFEDAYRAELRTWIDDLIDGEIVGPTAWDGYAAAVVAEAGVLSLRTGAEVPTAFARKPELYLSDG